MKKLVAILLLSVHLVNIAGGKLFFLYLLNKSDVEFTKLIDIGNYEAEHLVEIKVPLNLPYYSSTVKYERYYGEVNRNGKFFNYVMRKVMNDTAYYLCLPNMAKAKIGESKVLFDLAAFGMEDIAKNKKGNEQGKGKQTSGPEFEHLVCKTECLSILSGIPVPLKIYTADLASRIKETADRPPSTGLPVIS